MTDRAILVYLLDNFNSPSPAVWASSVETVLETLSPTGLAAIKIQIDTLKLYNTADIQCNSMILSVLKTVLDSIPANTVYKSSTTWTFAEQQSLVKDKVFIVHGHDKEMRAEMQSLLLQLGLNPIILGLEAPSGKTISEKLEKYSKSAAFAVVLYSADDGVAGKRRARQNVVFEHGLFVGMLGRDRVLALKRGNIEWFTDIVGTEFVDYEKSNWRYQVVDALIEAHFNVSKDMIRG